MKKIVKKVINKISTIDFDLDKTYKVQRKFYDIVRFNYLQIFDKKMMIMKFLLGFFFQKKVLIN